MGANRRHRHDDHDEGHGPGEAWLLPYADMITLLLGLFIVLFAMSSVDAKQFDHFKQALSQTFNGQVLTESGDVLNGSTGALDPVAANQDPSVSISMKQIEISTDAQRGAYAQEQASLSKSIRAAKMQDKVQVVSTERGIVIRLAGDAFFASGSDELLPSAAGILKTVATDVQRNKRTVAIEGHTDGAPISTPRFPDNLSLSFFRARSVYRLFAANSVPAGQMRATGYGAAHPLKAPPSPSASVRENRRVEIVILAAGGDAAEAASADTTPTPKAGAAQAGAADATPLPDIDFVKPFVVVGQ